MPVRPCLHVYPSICVCISVHLYMSAGLFVSVLPANCSCLFFHPCMSILPSIYVSVPPSIRPSISVGSSVPVCPSICVCLSVRPFVSVCLCIVLHICIYMAPFDSVHHTEALTVRKTEGKEGGF